MNLYEKLNRLDDSKSLRESDEREYCIVAKTFDGKTKFYKDGAFVDDYKSCTTFNDLDDARSEWFDVDKSKYKRVFVPVYDPESFAKIVTECNESVDDMDRRCEKCNTLLNDGGTCPKCDDGEEDLNESMNKMQLTSLFKGISSVWGKVMLNSEQADKLLASVGKEPTGKAATFDQVLSVIQDVLAYTPLTLAGITAILEAILDVILNAITIGLIACPVDGPAGEIITGIIAAIPFKVVVGALTAVPAGIASRIIQLLRKKLRQDELEKYEQALKGKIDGKNESIQERKLSNREKLKRAYPELDLNEKLTEGYSDEMTEFMTWIQDYRDGALWNDFTAEFDSEQDPDISVVLTWLENFDEDAYYDYVASETYDDSIDGINW